MAETSPTTTPPPAGFTPGELTIRHHPDKDRCIPSIVSPDGDELATLWGGGHTSKEECLANAYLWAAAPDLYAACRAAIEALGKANACASLPDHTRELCRDASGVALDALAKAGDGA